MALLTPQVGTVDGLVLTFGAAAVGGDTFLNTGREVLHVKNASGSPVTVTINAGRTCSYGSTHNKTVVVADGTTALIGPCRPDYYANGDTNITSVGYSAVTSVTVALNKASA